MITMGIRIFGVVCLLFSVAVHAQDIQQYVMCHLNDPGNSFVFLEDFPCSHVIFSYAKIEEETNSLYLPGTFKNQTSRLISLNKVPMVQIGGDDDREAFSAVTSTTSRRKEFIESIIKLTESNNFRGINLHWTYPGKSDPPEKRNYVNLAQELRKAYNGTVALTLPNQRNQIIPGFNLLFLNFVVDFFILPAYNFTYDAPPETYHHSPYSYPPESNVTDNSVLSMTRLYLRVGVVAERLVVGLPLFGRLVNRETHQIEDYELPNNQICKRTSDKEWQKSRATTGPYLTKENQTIFYDDVTSIIHKVSLVKDLRLGGVMFRSLEMEDWNSSCPNRENNDLRPSIKAAYNLLYKEPSRGYGAPTVALKPITAGYGYTQPFGEDNSKPVSKTPDNKNKGPSVDDESNLSNNDNQSMKNPSTPSTVYSPQTAAQGTSLAGSQGISQAGAPGTSQSVSQGSAGTGSISNQNSYPFSPGILPHIRIIEAGQDILIEDTQIQINENNYYHYSYIKRNENRNAPSSGIQFRSE